MTSLTKLADKIISRIKTQAELDALIEAAVLAEREACAKVCEEPEYYYEFPKSTTTDSSYKPRAKTNSECAAAIRARGEK